MQMGLCLPQVRVCNWFSDVDYSGKFVHQRGACLLGEAGGEYDTDIDTDINEKIKIKSEM